MHIGTELRRIATGQGLSQTAVADRIGDKQQNVGNDYKKRSLTFERMLRYSDALNHDFFQYYNNEEPYKSFRDQEHAKFREEIDDLKNRIDQLNKLLTSNEETIQTQKKLIHTQQTLIEKLQEEK